MSVQARVLDLFRDLQTEHGFACLFISHDLAAVEQVSSQIAVIHMGPAVVEVGPTEETSSARSTPTPSGCSAVPVPDPDQQRGTGRELRDSIIEQEHIVS